MMKPVRVHRHMRRRGVKLDMRLLIHTKNPRVKRFWKCLRSNKFPSPVDMPKVEQGELLRLYKSFVSGMLDTDLLEEVESKLIARAEAYATFVHCADSVATGEEEDNNELEDASQHILGGLFYSYGNDITERWTKLQRARDFRDFNKRMMAIDMFVHVLHDDGSLVGMFVSGIHNDDEGVAFLDELAGKSRRLVPARSRLPPDEGQEERS